MPRKKTKWTPISFQRLERLTGIRLQYPLVGAQVPVTRGAFPGENEQSRSMAVRIAGALHDMGIREAGAVGCLDRATRLVIGVSGKILQELGDKTGTLQDRVQQATPITFQEGIAAVIDNAVGKAAENTPACAERYLCSYRDGDLPVVAMSVVWYGGTGGRLAPTSYQALSSQYYETMAPCSDCVSISALMMRVARNED